MNKILSLFLINTLAFSYPTPESLFVNGSNQEITNETIITTFKITEIPGKEVLSLVSPRDLDVDKDRISRVNSTPQFYRATFQKKTDGSWRYLQAQYGNSSMKNDSIVHLFTSDSFSKLMYEKVNLNPVQDLFYASMFMIFLNDSKPFSNFLKISNQSFKTNKELVNLQKKDLLESYGKYLQTIKDDPDLEKEIINPLKPDDPEEYARVEDLQKQGYYLNFPGLSLIREDKNFYLKLALEKFEARFTNKGYRLDNFTFEDLGRRVEASFYNYVLLNGKHEVPKYMIYRVGSRQYRVEFLGLKHLNYNNVTYRRVKSALEEAVGKTNKTFDFNERPKFLM